LSPWPGSRFPPRRFHQTQSGGLDQESSPGRDPSKGQTAVAVPSDIPRRENRLLSPP
jgi:hypothetical protein